MARKAEAEPRVIKVAHFIVGHPYPQYKAVEDELKTLQDLVGGFIEMVRLPNGLVLLCNEEGLMRRLPVGFAVMANHGVQTIHGNFFVCRESGENFASLRETDSIYLVAGVVPIPQD